MSRKQLLLSVATGVLLAWLIGMPLGGWLSERSDAAWWQTLPWVLLALFWAGIGFLLWRRRGTSHRA
jgi:hypothetical protein